MKDNGIPPGWKVLITWPAISVYPPELNIKMWYVDTPVIIEVVEDK